MPKPNRNRPPTNHQFKPSKPRIDLTNRQYGRLTILHFVGRYGRRYFWQAQCVCGNRAVVDSANLKKGTKSCGCLNFDRIFKHGLSGTLEYGIWGSMRDRCNNPQNPSYEQYGGRGIKVCERWDDFNLFLADMGKKPSPIHSIDRINNNGNYEPDNCKWSTPKEQSYNRRTTCLLTVLGNTLPITAWAERINLAPSTLKARLYRGWLPEDAVSIPGGQRKNQGFSP